tara:strand:- start:1684 stop:1875 length:192 start_codon:yes stop_codon:yes gene_type:complete
LDYLRLWKILLGNYDYVTTGTNNAEQLYNWGDTSDHLVGLGGDDQLFGLAANDKHQGSFSTVN